MCKHCTQPIMNPGLRKKLITSSAASLERNLFVAVMRDDTTDVPHARGVRMTPFGGTVPSAPALGFENTLGQLYK